MLSTLKKRLRRSGRHDGPGRTPRVAILGAGAGGLAMAIALEKAGIHSYTLFEKNDGVGGTWRDNRYPGAQCDIMSHVYSYSFELKRDWSRLYAHQPEILAYLEHCADKYHLQSHLRRNTAVVEARWDEATATWRLRTETGEEVEADIVVSGLGMLNVAHYPEVAALETFDGFSWHSSRWNPNIDLAGKRIGVIGNGASALQFIPEIAPDVAHLSLFQRTPQWVMPSIDRPYTESELRRFRWIPGAARLYRAKAFWRYERLTSFHLSDPARKDRRDMAMANLERGVPNPELRARLTPDYPIGCKRLIRSATWYPTLSQPNVSVVTEKISQASPSGIVTADGVEHPLDVLIFATGFQATNYLSGVDIYGQDGRRLHDEWADGAEAYRGVAVSGYPNLFLLYGPNTNQPGNSIIFILESQVHFTMSAIRHLMRTGAAALDVRRPVMDKFNRRLQAAMDGTIWAGGCTTYYKDASGKITTQWPHRAIRYWAVTRRIQPSHFEATPASSPGDHHVSHDPHAQMRASAEAPLERSSHEQS